MSLIALAALAAGTVAIPEPVGNPERWLTAADIPKSEFDAGNDGSLILRLLVRPDGKADKCTVLASSAPKADWTAFCARVERRFAYRPVTDHQGAPSYFLIETNYAYLLPETWVRSPVPMPAELVLDVKQLPGVKDGKRVIAVNVAIAADGALQQCNGASVAGAEALSRTACAQLKASWTPLPAKNAAGQAVAYVRQMNVEFREQKAGG